MLAAVLIEILALMGVYLHWTLAQIGITLRPIANQRLIIVGGLLPSCAFAEMSSCVVSPDDYRAWAWFLMGIAIPLSTALIQ